MKSPLRHKNSAKIDQHPLRRVRGIWEKKIKSGENWEINPYIRKDSPKHHNTLKATNGMPVYWLKDK